jgi:hypothetical protein
VIALEIHGREEGPGTFRNPRQETTAAALRVSPDELPTRSELHQNGPNPFGERTTIHFALGSAGNTKLDVFDVRGRLVRVLVDRYLESGSYEIPWDGKGPSGRKVPSGVYFGRLRSGSFTQSIKMILAN